MLVTSVAVSFPLPKQTHSPYLQVYANQCWLVTQFEGLEQPVLVLVSKTQTLFGSEFGTGFESGTETRLSSELVTERGSQFYLFVELELELELRCWGTKKRIEG